MFNGGSQSSWVTSAGVIPNDQGWHMLSLTFQASTAVRFYVDGVEVHAVTTGIPSGKNNPSMIHSWGALSSSNIASSMGATPLLPLNGYIAHGFLTQSVVSAATLLGIYDAVLGTVASAASGAWSL